MKILAVQHVKLGFIGLGNMGSEHCPHTGCGKRRLEVKALSPHDRFVIALHSLDGVGEIGLCLCPAEKSARKLARGVRRTLSPVRF